MRVTVACTVSERLRGLLFKDGFDGILILTPCNDVHTFGMRQPIDIAFVSSEGLVLDSYLGVVPFRRIRCRRAAATLERFSKSSKWFEPGDTIDLKQLAKGVIV